MEIENIEKILRTRIKNTKYNTFKDIERIFRIRDEIQSIAKRKVTLEEAYEYLQYIDNVDISNGGNCIDLSTIIQKDLKEKGIESKIVAYRTNGMLLENADDILEFGHYTNIVREQDENGKGRYHIIDLGMFIPNVISFEEGCTSIPIKLSNGKYARVEFQPQNKKLPYRLSIGEVNKDGEFSAKDYAEFNPDVESKDKFSETYKNYFKVAPGYRVVCYDENGSKNHAVIIDIASKKIKIICNMLDRKRRFVAKMDFHTINSQTYDSKQLEQACKEIGISWESIQYVIENFAKYYEEFKTDILDVRVKDNIEKKQLERDVENILSKKVLPEFENGKVRFHGHDYEIGFSTQYNEDNTEKKDVGLILNMHERKKVVLQLTDFIGKALDKQQMKWVKSRQEYSKEEVIEHLLKQIWFNATKEDFNNPIAFIRLQSKFLEDDTFAEFEKPKELGNIPSLDNNILKVQRVEQSGSNETPYMLNFDIVDKDNPDNIYDLPSVRYVVDKDTNTAYIYAIQKRKGNKDTEKTRTVFQKSINRKLYKLNDGILQIESKEYQEFYKKRQKGENTENIDVPENVTDVTHSFLISLEATISLLKTKGINHIVVPKLLPLRQQVELRFEEEKAKRIQENVSKKFIRTFKRLSKHFSQYNYDENNDYLVFDSSSQETEHKVVVKNPILSDIEEICYKKSNKIGNNPIMLSDMTLKQKAEYLSQLEVLEGRTAEDMEVAKAKLIDSHNGEELSIMEE